MKVPFRKHSTQAFLMGCFIASVASAQNSKATEAEADSPLGIWRGESVCVTAAPSCRDEQVVYSIRAIADHPDSVFVRADKIVDGKAITMGSGPWQYNRTKHVLSMESEQRVWLLSINGKRMEGTLTLPNNVLFRRMTLIMGD
jgi:hypothetical protein